MSRSFKIVILSIAAAVILSCLGLLLPLDILAALLTGWAFYVARVLPQLQINWSGVATGIICLVGFSVGLHVFLVWLCAQWKSRQDSELVSRSLVSDSISQGGWERRWTAAAVVLILLSFTTGMAATGITHQVGWLFTETDPFLSGSGGARTAARRAMSMNNLKQIGRAVTEIEGRDKALPPGCTVDSDGEVLHGWMTFLLPFVEKQQLLDEIDLKIPWDAPHNLGAFKQDVSEFQNPGFPAKEYYRDESGLSLTGYAANVHVLGGKRRLAFADIKDGTADTILAGEIAERLPPWGKPGNWRDPAKGINRSALGFGGPWTAQGAPGGATILFADGSIRFIKDSIDPKILESLGTPHGGEVVSSDAY